MKKILTIGLLSGYLFMALVLSHVHNHPVTQAENDSCPAHIIASVVFSESVPIDLSEVAAVEFNGIFLFIPSATLYPQTVLLHHSNRAPPVSC